MSYERRVLGAAGARVGMPGYANSDSCFDWASLITTRRRREDSTCDTVTHGVVRERASGGLV